MIKLATIKKRLEAMDYIVFDRKDNLLLPVYQVLTKRYTPLVITVDKVTESIVGDSETGKYFEIALDSTNKGVMWETLVSEIATYSYMDALDMAREFKKLSV